MPLPTIVALAVVATLILAIILIYNGLARGRVRVKTAWAQIDAQLKRRTDLIPNLVASVRGYFEHEASVLRQVSEAREAAMSAGNDLAGRAQAEGVLSGALGRLVARVEAMPDLKADSSVLSLQEELATTENRIAFARSHYNDTVGAYNARIATFPALLIARPGGFGPEAFFAVQGVADVPVVQLSTTRAELTRF